MSLAHGWSSGVTTWLTQAILGVRPVEPGRARRPGRVSIRPELADLTWARGRVPTPRGPIEVSVRKERTTLRAEVTLPPGTTADVALPGQPARELGPGRHRLTTALLPTPDPQHPNAGTADRHRGVSGPGAG